MSHPVASCRGVRLRKSECRVPLPHFPRKFINFRKEKKSFSVSFWWSCRIEWSFRNWWTLFWPFQLSFYAVPRYRPHLHMLLINWSCGSIGKFLRSPRCRTRSPITLLETWRALSIVLSFTGDWVPTKQDREVRTRISGMSSDHTLPSARNNARTDGVAATGCGKLSRWRNRSSFSLLIARHSGLPSLEACDSSWDL